MKRSNSWRLKALWVLCGVALAAPVGIPGAAVAGPPHWAPAHGARAKHKKKRKYYRAAPAPAVALPRIPLSNCNRQLVGTLVGGAAGGLLGSKIGKGTGNLAATAAGTLIGALIGGSVGRSMDQVDQSCVGNVLETAQTGQSVAWRNPDNGGHYEVTPVRTRTTADNRYCREYTAKSTVGGRTETTFGTACRQSDGIWQLGN